MRKNERELFRYKASVKTKAYSDRPVKSHSSSSPMSRKISSTSFFWPLTPTSTEWACLCHNSLMVFKKDGCILVSEICQSLIQMVPHQPSGSAWEFSGMEQGGPEQNQATYKLTP